MYGIDLSVNMILTALEMAAAGGNGDKVSFEVSDATKRDLPEASFDAVFSRDALLHVADKPALFARLHRMLKPGGRVVISDYCRGSHQSSQDFNTYMDQRKYTLHPIAEYGEMLHDAGFVGVAAEDRSDQLAGCLAAELAKVEADGSAFVDALGEAALADVKDSWRAKLGRVEAGEHRWGLFSARKAA